MCVAIISPNRQHRPSIETLQLCAERNPHGSGFAWIEHKQACYLKGRSPKQIALDLETVKGPVIIHFRIRSVGPVDLRLCHPFEVAEEPEAKLYGSAKSLLFANGTWAGWQKWAKQVRLNLHGPVSDTRLAAAAVWQNGFDWLEDSGCKFVLLNRKGWWRTIGQFYEHDDGCLYSNLYWLPPRQPDLFPKQDNGPRWPHRRIGEAMACFGD